VHVHHAHNPVADAFARGRAAALAGRPRVCPEYDAADPERAGAWLAGWLDGAGARQRPEPPRCPNCGGVITCDVIEGYGRDGGVTVTPAAWCDACGDYVRARG
jgi:ribosome modulation factor